MWSKLNQRERFLLILAAAFVLILTIILLFQIIAKKRKELRLSIERSRSELQTLIRLKEDISSIPSVRTLPNRNQLLTLVTQKLQELQVTPNNIRDREERIGKGNSKMIIIDLSFNGVNLQKLFQFIYELEYNQSGVKIKELLIRKPLPGRDIFDVRMSIYVISKE
ncbi:MAG: hypothetical protein KatS3mg129_3285 [Leptospiraceae bacterium]|nr:MAG: hypothetical protein KatS3mg129_3285 [Leptospiraceae bacterium]